MFVLNGKPLALDRAFTTEDGRQFPANWLRLATPEERAAVGITEEPDPIVNYDQRFYWGPNNPKDHAQLVEQWTATIKQTAGSLLAPTDWYITRASETGLAAPQSVLERRYLIRYLSNNKEAYLEATETTDELAAYVTGPEFNVWEEIPPETTNTFTSNSVSGQFGSDTITFE
jgi:hypothetical protein